MTLIHRFPRSLAICIAIAAASPAPSQSPAPTGEILELKLENGRLGGAGGERLRRELGGVQFVALGEDHGFAGSPELAAALGSELAKASGKPVHLAVEVGPQGTAWAAQKLNQGGLHALHAGLKGQPFALPFLTNVEDARLSAPYARSGRLWGIDQEFIGSTAQLFEDLAVRCAAPAAASKLRELAKADRTALNAGEFDKAVMSAMPPAEILQLGRDCGGKGTESLLEPIAASAQIYQYNNSRQYSRNNEERSGLMAGYFMSAYRQARVPAPRVVLKMGAYHMGRGTTPTRIYDLGSYLPALAAQNGLRSLHIAWLPIGGKVRQIRPDGTSFTKVAAYEDDTVTPLLKAAGIDPAKVPETGYVLIPLQPIRYAISGKALDALPAMTRFTVLGFDYLVTTRDARPATHFEAWDGN